MACQLIKLPECFLSHILLFVIELAEKLNSKQLGLVQNRCSRALKKKNEHKGKRFKPAELNNIGTIVIVKCGQCTLFTL